MQGKNRSDIQLFQKVVGNVELNKLFLKNIFLSSYIHESKRKKKSNKVQDEATL